MEHSITFTDYSAYDISARSGMSFSEKESLCESLFNSTGPFWHLTNNGTKMEVIFTTREDYRFAMNAIAVSVLEENVGIITFEVMSDHIHFLLQGTEECCLAFFNRVKHKLMSYFTRSGRTIEWKPFEVEDPIEIMDLRTLRNEIVYTNRNGFLVDTSKTPFSYPWGAGYLYYNAITDMDLGVPCSGMSYRLKREKFHLDKVSFPSEYRYQDGIILPSSYCNIALGQAVFRDGAHYFNLLSKAFEAYSETAKRLGDNIFLTDEEMYPALVEICRKQFGSQSPRNLGIKQKINVARIMHKEYNSSNEQIRRMLSMDISIINQLFPPK